MKQGRVFQFVNQIDSLTPPLARAIAMIAAASITHDKGFHINPKNFKNFLSCTQPKHIPYHQDKALQAPKKTIKSYK